MTEADWSRVAGAFDARLVAALRRSYERPGLFATSAAELRSFAGPGIALADAERLLATLAKDGHLTVRTELTCAACEEPLMDEEAGGTECPHCHVAFVDQPPNETIVYARETTTIRDVSWMFVLHGMNSPGTWQEELQTLVALTYRHLVPVTIYKYGIVRPGVLFRFRQSQLVEEVAAKLAQLIGRFAQLDSVRTEPDVIAHSFGTWLLAEALRRHRDLRIGRLVLLGSVVRPDFRWDELIARGQVDAVLNHVATRDRVVPAAEWIVPDSGPSGRKGFAASPRVINLEASGLGHSDYFDAGRIGGLYSTVWEPFFVHDDPLARIPAPTAATPWRPRRRWLTGTTRGLTILAGVPIFAALPQLVVEGVPYLLDRFSRPKPRR